MNRRTSAHDDEDRAPGQPTRLEQEIEEILARGQRPISLQERIQARQYRARPNVTGRLHGIRARAATLTRNSAGWPLIGSLVVAAVAAMVADGSALLAQILAVVSVALFLLPVVVRFRRPDPPSTRMWRGRPIDGPPRGPSSVRGHFRDRFRPPGTGR